MRRATLLACLLAGLTLAASGVAGQEPNPEDPRVERALELRRELERLLAELPLELRLEVERRWEDQGTGMGAVGSESDSGGRKALPYEAADAPARGSTTPGAATVEAVPAAPPRCGTLDILDSNGDGVVSGLDRYWRYLGLWRDDGDGALEESEVRSLFQNKIRRVSARLYSYTTAKDSDGGVWIEDSIYFDLPGKRSRAVLTINAGGLARGGELWLEDLEGGRLDGHQALRSGLTWVSASEERTAVLCR